MLEQYFWEKRGLKETKTLSIWLPLTLENFKSYKVSSGFRLHETSLGLGLVVALPSFEADGNGFTGDAATVLVVACDAGITTCSVEVCTLIPARDWDRPIPIFLYSDGHRSWENKTRALPSNVVVLLLLPLFLHNPIPAFVLVRIQVTI